MESPAKRTATLIVLLAIALPGCADSQAQKQQRAETPEQEKAKTQVEVDLGEYRFKTLRPASGATLKMSFHLHGVIDREDVEQFAQLWKTHRLRVRDQVLVTVRSSEWQELSNPDLTMLRARILWWVNKALGEEIVRKVILSRYWQEVE